MSKSFFGPKSGLIAALAAAAVSGCVTTVAADGTRMRLRSEEFADYAEQVFRLQNDILDALAFALDEQPEEVALSTAEDDVLQACSGLNAIAVRRQRGERTPVLAAARAARRVPDCESAANVAAELLRSRSP